MENHVIFGQVPSPSALKRKYLWSKPMRFSPCGFLIMILSFQKQSSCFWKKSYGRLSVQTRWQTSLGLI